MRTALLIALALAFAAPSGALESTWHHVPFPEDMTPRVLDMDMDGGTVWLSTRSKGLLAYDGMTWVNHRAADHPEQGNGLRSDRFKSTMFVDLSGGKWTVRENPMWLDRLDDGGTFTDKTDDEWTYYDQAAGQLESGRVFSMAQDLAGNMWFGIRDESSTEPSMLELLIQDGANDEWHAFGDGFDPPIFSAQDVRGLEVDLQGRLWIIYDRSGVDVWDFGDYLSFDDDTIVHYGAVDGLPSDAVYAVHAAADGRIWVGAGSGVAVLDRGGDYWRIVEWPDDLSDEDAVERVYDIDSDAQGHVWVGTDQGAAMILSGSEVWRTYGTIEDSLPSAPVSMIAVDQVDGTVWAVSGDPEFSPTSLYALESEFGPERILMAYPNPWKETEADQKYITILGAPPGSKVELFDITGQMVRELDATGEPFRWDSLDADLNEVASGVYIVRVETPAGEQLFTKIAIIR